MAKAIIKCVEVEEAAESVLVNLDRSLQRELAEFDRDHPNPTSAKLRCLRDIIVNKNDENTRSVRALYALARAAQRGGQTTMEVSSSDIRILGIQS